LISVDKFSVIDASVRPSSHITAIALLTLVLIILEEQEATTKLKAFVPQIVKLGVEQTHGRA
jgi:hypothetical protein